MKEGRPAEVILEAVDRFGEDRLALAASWQKETAVLVDLVRRHAPGARIFTLDTGVLFPETYATWRAVEARYGIAVEAWRGDWVPGLWSTDPDRCCSLRKVEPLERALEDADCWISGVRRDQSPDRAGTEELDWDERHGLWKANPLATWSERDVWAYIARARPPVQPAARPGLLLDRLHALHAPRQGARGPLGRPGQDGVRHCTCPSRHDGAMKSANTRWHDGAVTPADRAAALGFGGATALVHRPARLGQVHARGRGRGAARRRRAPGAPARRRQPAPRPQRRPRLRPPRTARRTSAARRTPPRCSPRPASSRSSRSSRPTRPTATTAREVHDGGRRAVPRDLGLHRARGVRAARPQGPLREGARGRAARPDRRRRRLRAAGRRPTWRSAAPSRSRSPPPACSTCLRRPPPWVRVP